MKLFFLGCGGWIPHNQQTSCFVVEYNNHLIMLDAGTGIANLPFIEGVYDKYDSVSIILSHYHLDHIIGLIYLLPYLKDKVLNIYGPGRPVYKLSTEDQLNIVFQKDLFSRPLRKIAKEVSCFDYGGHGFVIDDIVVTIDKQQHSSPSFQITIDDVLRYSTDTCFDKSIVEKNKGASVLLHECWSVDGSGFKHSSLNSIMEELNRDLFDTIFLVHHNPEWESGDIDLIKTMIEGTNIVFPHDGDVVEI